MSSEETQKKGKKPSPPVSAEQVSKYLKAHPDFLATHPELLEVLKSPAADKGEGVVDLQQFMVGNLQKELKTVRGKYDEMVEFCRDNMSTQSQVHHAVVSIIKAHDLEQLLQIITVDLMHVFNVDVVRLSMETEGADMYDASYPDAHYSGITFIENGMTDLALGHENDILLCSDTTQEEILGFEEIFAECHGMIRACALLRLHLESVGKDVILGFGVRHAGAFDPNQGIELLSFLATVIEHRLDECLSVLDPESLM